MAQKLSSDAARGMRGGQASVHFLPHRRVGWAALVLLLGTAAYPLYWGSLEMQLGPAALVTVAVVLVLASVGLGSVALFWSQDRSVLLSMAYALAVFLVLLGLMFELALLFTGL